MQSHSTNHGCSGCRHGDDLGFEFEYAFQPIVDVVERRIYAHEALIRGPQGEGAYTVLEKVTADNTYRFDQACRVKAVESASTLGLGTISINFFPNAVYRPELCIRTTLAAAEACNFPISNIIFEFTEVERIKDTRHLHNIVDTYQQLGFRTALDDFGAGYAGLNLLAQFQPDLIKLDMDMVRNIDQHKPRQSIVRHMVKMCTEMGVEVLAEGIETAAERDFLADQGIRLMQGYWFAKPAFKQAGHIPDSAWA